MSQLVAEQRELFEALKGKLRPNWSGSKRNFNTRGRNCASGSKHKCEASTVNRNINRPI